MDSADELLMRGVYDQHLGSVERALRDGADELLMRGVFDQHLGSVERALRDGADPNELTRGVFDAALAGRGGCPKYQFPDIMRALLAAGLRPDTPLMHRIARHIAWYADLLRWPEYATETLGVMLKYGLGAPGGGADYPDQVKRENRRAAVLKFAGWDTGARPPPAGARTEPARR